MGRTIHIFNIEHDLAIANNNSNYIPPRVCAEMDQDLGTLPLWYGSDHEITLTTEHISPKIAEALSMNQLSMNPAEYIPIADDSFQTWGWDKAIEKKIRFISPDSNLPDSDIIRKLSHRRLSIELLKEHAKTHGFPQELLPEEVYSTERIKDITEQRKSLLKAPLSGSGRGLWWGLSGYDFNVERWSKRTLQQQHSVIVEPIWEKTADYAIEFECKGGAVKFVGFSHFLADPAGVYRCNLLLSDEAIERKLAQEIGKNTIQEATEISTKFIQRQIAPYYNGYLGIDMLTGIYKGQMVLNPGVEINLRMTMGIVARLFYNKYVKEGKSGTFKTVHFKYDGEMISHVNEMETIYPLQIKNHKITRGYLILTAYNQHTRYGIEVTID
jgi:hypothetical protein